MIREVGGRKTWHSSEEEILVQWSIEIAELLKARA